jgi:hypothetical protein
MSQSSTTDEPDRRPRQSRRTVVTNHSSGGAVYGLGMVGALVYYWQSADSGGQHVLAVLKAIVWPAFLVYQAFKGLNG